MGASQTPERADKPTCLSAALLKNIKGLLAQHQLSQAEFARRAGVPTTTLNRLVNDLESGLSPRLETLETVANGFGISVSQLMAGDVAAAHVRSAPASAHLTAKLVGRLVEDFLSCDEAGRTAILRLAEEESARCSDRQP